MGADDTRALSIIDPAAPADQQGGHVEAHRAAVPLPAPALPWHQQQGEGDKAYQAFEIYRNLGPARSITTVERTLSKSRGLISRWSSAHQWVARCRAYDLHNQQQEEQIAREKRAEDLRTTLKRHDDTATNLLTISRRMLMPPLDLRERARAGDAQAQRELDSWVPTAETVRAATMALDKAVYHQRLAAGLPTNVTQQDVMLRTQVQEQAEISESVLRLLEEFTCDDCKALILPHIRRLVERVAGVKAALPEGLL